MEFSEAKRLLDPAPMMLETGVERTQNGGLHVAMQFLMEHCTADMLDYWFGAAPDTLMYQLWHPGAHISSEWKEFTPDHVPGKVHGSTHYSTEDVGMGASDATLSFIDPAEILGKEALDEAKRAGGADVVLYASCGMEPRENLRRDEKGRVIGDHQFIIGRDTPFGLAVRLHFWLGSDVPLPKEEVEKMFPAELGLGIMNHGLNEFHILGKVIPSFYLKDRWSDLGAPEPFGKSNDSAKAHPRTFA
ncbi:MAG: hypothetical protein IJ106_07495 [Parasporobacterium sp.]|nr:hypothetical protein [Parasporobacterium sp.]